MIIYQEEGLIGLAEEVADNLDQAAWWEFWLLAAEPTAVFDYTARSPKHLFFGDGEVWTAAMNRVSRKRDELPKPLKTKEVFRKLIAQTSRWERLKRA